MDVREHWRRVYEDKRPDELSWYQPSPETSLAALDSLGADHACSLVDIGGGASALADALVERGWQDANVVDIAQPALAASKTRLGTRAKQVKWLVADVRQWRPGRTFEIWHDRAVFHFLTQPGDRAGYKRALAEGTCAGSRVIIATFAVDGPEMCSGLPVQRYDAPLLAAELDADFRLLRDWRETHVTPWGTEQHFQWCAFERV
jgi:hypothetical protein